MNSARRSNLARLAEAGPYNPARQADDALEKALQDIANQLKGLSMRHTQASSARSVKLKVFAAECAKKISDTLFTTAGT